MNISELEEKISLLSGSPLIAFTNSHIDIIKNATKFLIDEYEEIPNRQRIWHIRKKSYSLVVCECGNRSKWSKSKGYYVSCSDACKQRLAQKIQKEKYGGSYLESNEFKKRMIDEYGTIFASQTESIKLKSKETCLRKYNVDNVSKTMLSKESFKKTSMKNWGVEHPMFDQNIKSYSVQKSKENSERSVVNNKISCERKYGIGITNAMMAETHKTNKKHKDLENFQKNVDINRYIVKNFLSENILINHLKCSNDFIINRSTFINRNEKKHELCTICNPLSKFFSIEEKEVLDYIKTIYKGEIFENVRILQPYEFDIWIPELKLAIDYNGLYWHSTEHKYKSYHIRKKNFSQLSGIDLMMVWSDHWNNKKDIIKSILSQRFNKNLKIGARQLKLIKLSNKESIKFLNKNHIQGYVPFKIGYALCDDDEIFQLMTFNKIDDEKYEISRLCTKLFINVVGGTQRLIHAFNKDHKIKKLISYSNRDYFKGVIYETIGMKFIKNTDPSYYYTLDFTNREERHKFQKRKLVAKGMDEKLSESEIMEKLGYKKFYNCGNQFFELDYHN